MSVTLYLISDASGNLLEHFFKAVLTQFPKSKFQTETLPFIRNSQELHKALDLVSSGIVFHAFSSQEMKTAAQQECESRKLPCWDVTGPTVLFLEKASGVKSSKTPKPIHPVDDEYRNRMRAVEFTMQHDDSRRIETIDQAEIILVGISRVSKSPTSLFLAYRGFRVANISIVPEQGLPEELEKYSGKNVVALTIQPKKLAEIRGRRFKDWHVDNLPYQDLQEVIREVVEAEKIYKKKGWPVIDTTDLAVEETSAHILQEIHLKPKVLS